MKFSKTALFLIVGMAVQSFGGNDAAATRDCSDKVFGKDAEGQQQCFQLRSREMAAEGEKLEKTPPVVPPDPNSANLSKANQTANDAKNAAAGIGSDQRKDLSAINFDKTELKGMVDERTALTKKINDGTYDPEANKEYLTSLDDAIIEKKTELDSKQYEYSANNGARDSTADAETLAKDQAAQAGVTQAENSVRQKAFDTAQAGEGYRQQGGFKARPKNNDDNCKFSTTIDGKQYGCNFTAGVVTGAQITNQVSNMAATVTTQMQGQSNIQKASQEGTQSAAMMAAAKSQKSTGQIQMGMGAVNALLGATQLFQALKHDKNIKKIEGQISTEQGDVQSGIQNALTSAKTNNANDGTQTGQSGYFEGKVVQKFGLNNAGTLQAVTAIEQTLRLKEEGLRARGIQAKGAHINNLLDDVKDSATSEQAGIKGKAMGGGTVSLITGIQQSVQGGFNIKAAAELEKAAKELRRAEGKSNPVLLPTFGNNIDSKPQVARARTVITGSGEAAEAQQEAEEEVAENTPLDLGTGFAPDGNPNGLTGPALPPAAFQKGGAGGGGEGGGGGGLAGGSTGEATDPNAPQQAAVGAGSDSPGYASGGGVPLGGGRGGGGGAGGDEGPDLAALMDKFLGQNQEQAEEGFDGSMEQYGGRSPASQPYSFLDRNVDIFGRIHQTYQQKHKVGAVGI